MNRPQNLLSLLTESEVSRSKGLLHFYEDFSVGKVLSKEELLHQALARASDWREWIQEGDKVLLALENGVRFVESFFALIALGAVPVPLAPHIDSGPFQRKTGARFIVCENGLQGIKNLFPIPRGTQELPQSKIKNHPLALIQFSSGSTSEPKGILMSHEAVLINLLQIKKGMAVSPSDVLSGWLPFFHDMGLVGCVLSPLFNDVAAHLMSPRDFIASSSRWLGTVVESQSTIILGPNFLYRHLIEKVGNKASYDLSGLRLALCGSEPVSCEIGEKFLEDFAQSGLRKSAFFPVYGMAEAVLALAFPRVGVPFTSGRWGSRRVASCGSALDGTEISVVDAAGSPCAEAQEGRILVRGPSLFRSYLGEPPREVEDFDTGDLGFIKEGELYVTGRSKDLMVIRGRKIHPQDIEQMLFNDGGVKEKLVVFSVWDSCVGEERVHVVLEVRSPLRNLEARVKQACYSRFQLQVEGVHPVPLQTLPRTSSGKIRRFELERMYKEGAFNANALKIVWALARHSFTKGTARVSSQLKSQRDLRRDKKNLSTELSRIFSEVMEIPLGDVHFDKAFAEYEMDSVRAVQLNFELKERLAEVPLGDFISFKILKDVEEYLWAHHQEEVRRALRAQIMEAEL